MDFIPAYRHHWRTLAEVERIKAVTCRDSLYKRQFERFSGAYCFTNTHGMLVNVRQNMCGVPVWSWFRHICIIEGLWRKLRGWKWWNVDTVCMNVNLSDFRVCVDLIQAYLYHWRTLAEVESINAVKCRDLVYKRQHNRSSGACCLATTYGMLVVVRQNMRVVPAWTWIRHIGIIEGLWRKSRG